MMKLYHQETTTPKIGASFQEGGELCIYFW